ncbi:5-formyltetrahydrofolate cyclo-ligase [Protaetiibacter sp. SSC-01]|uniref:5-formyltetrahydrofolate cyclo-ligase n=1 Tax=Protaetiibacter sp. SSC-01 TaxID=2759943 RepID=UPI0016573EB4|nr:5-formyltetrahydrofolate cyclo-ligase [Protaetiibacter sp. SSC-01]QNO37990.1 5-formyltetrahydrofolate cyclo-ligase [Protaetiibacter sp. SSC-01]
MPDEAENRKRAMRAELRERRRIRTATERERATEALTRHLVQLASDLDVGFIAAYLSTPDEPETRGFLRWADERGIRILLPVSREDGLLDWAPYDGADEEQDMLGMPTPSSELLGPIAINGVDLILVPAAGVARDGMRLGWGRGYFDKTLGSMEGCPPVYAVIYDDELVDEVPVERHDMPVDGVVTPSGILTFAKR